jgi:6-phosphogluconolactonase
LALAKDLDSTLQEEFLGKSAPLNFDIVILSMGEDGHIASCFPGDTKVLHSTESAASISNSPKPPAERTTITLHRLGQSEITFIFALGEGKREALVATLAGSSVMPIELLRQNSPSGEILILADLQI